jgi:hypothetical protein
MLYWSIFFYIFIKILFHKNWSYETSFIEETNKKKKKYSGPADRTDRPAAGSQAKPSRTDCTHHRWNPLGKDPMVLRFYAFQTYLHSNPNISIYTTSNLDPFVFTCSKLRGPPFPPTYGLYKPSITPQFRFPFLSSKP